MRCLLSLSYLRVFSPSMLYTNTVNSIPLNSTNCNLHNPTNSLPLMGTACVCCFFLLPKPIEQLIQIIRRIRFILDAILSHVGIRPSPEIFLNHVSDRLPAASSNPLLAIKRELPEVEFASLYSKKSHGDNEVPICVVCLRWLEAKDVVRELGNCDHAIHRECIDRWVYAGHVTCPLCRSQLWDTREERR